MTDPRILGAPDQDNFSFPANGLGTNACNEFGQGEERSAGRPVDAGTYLMRQLQRPLLPQLMRKLLTHLLLLPQLHSTCHVRLPASGFPE